MGKIFTFFGLSFIGLSTAFAVTQYSQGNEQQALCHKLPDDSLDASKRDNKASVENSLRHAISTPENNNQKMNISNRMHYYNVPGVSIAIVDQGKIVWANGYGNISNNKTSTAVDEHTLFQAGSISKSLTAYGALLLVQQGKISLDEDVNTYLRSWKVPENEFTQTEKVTLRRLLSHTAGTSVHGFPGYATDNEIPSIIDVLDGIKPLVNTDPVRVIMQPGTQFKYSGGGTTIVQLLIEDVTDKKFDDWMQENVLTPLEMSESTFLQPFSSSHASHAAYGHQKSEKVDGHWHIYPEKAAAGLWSTPTDLAKFLLHIQSTLTTGESVLLNPTLVKEMVTKQLPTGTSDEPGLGFFLKDVDNDSVFLHYGQDEGFIASLYGFFSSNQGAVIMMNNDTGWGLMREIQHSISDVYGWPDFRPIAKEPVSLNNSILNSLSGKFVDKEENVVEISIINNNPYIHFQEGFVSIVYGFGHPVELFAANDSVYFIQEANLSIECNISPSKEVQTIVLIHPDKERTILHRASIS